jgi:ankyrin repeat protein
MSETPKDFIDRMLLKQDPSLAIYHQFQLACENGDLQKIKELLANPELITTDHRFEFAFEMACNRNQPEVIELLLQHKAFDPVPRAQVYMNIACYNGNIKILNLLLKDGRISLGSNKDYCLLVAGFKNHPEIVQILNEAK